jgi:hypothetical protein
VNRMRGRPPDLGKRTLRGVMPCALALLAACAASRHSLVLAPVGPISGGRERLAGGEGFLRVYTATRAHDSGGITFYPHTPYVVYNAEGRRVQGVQNHVGLQDQKPMTVPLPQGRYVVYAQAEGHGRVTLPIAIVASRTTVVFLEGKGLPEATELPEAEVVRLPDGRPVGRRAMEPAPPRKP